jgi:tetracycline resistance efflux pump
MQNTWVVLIPQILVLVLAFTTHKIILSLFCGIVSASLILNNFAIITSAQMVIDKIWKTSDLSTLSSWSDFINNWTIFMLGFLTIIGIIIVLINHSGGAYAYSNFIKKNLKNKTNVQSASLFLSFCLFIDDYLSSLTVGSVMRSISDEFKIAKVKIAFLADSMAAPLVILFPVSSWAAYIIMQLNKSGISDTTSVGTYVAQDPFITYLSIIPFLFFSFITILTTIFIVRKNISIGLMKKHEDLARKTGNLFGGKEATTQVTHDVNEKNKETAKMIDLLLPIATLFLAVIGSMLYTGSYKIFGGQNDLIATFRAAKPATSLFIGALIAIVVTLILYFVRKRITLNATPKLFWQGFCLMKRSLMVLLLAWTFTSFLKDDLFVGQYLASLLLGQAVIKILPALFFAASAIIAITMGSTWGCIAILTPIAIPMVVSMLQTNIPANIQAVSILLPTLGAIFSGAVSANLISPLSDTTIMSAASTGCNHIDHVRTQHTYAIPALICTGIAFLICGLLINSVSMSINVLISLGIGILLNFSYLLIRNRTQNN